MQLRQAAALHHARYGGGFHSAASLAAAQAAVKFVPHNTPAFSQIKNKKQSHFTASGKVSDRRIKVQGYINEAASFVFQWLARP
jgi:hypothetical protein